LWLIDFIEDLFPSTPLAYIFYLAFFVVFGIFLIYLIAKLKPQKNENIQKSHELSLDDLLEIVSNKSASSQDLIKASQLFYENFKVSDDEKKSFEFFKLLLNHPNRNKTVFDIFHGRILPKNIEYKEKLDMLERKALNK